MRDLINIPKGNAFNLHVCPQRIAPKQENASFNDITDFSVSVTRQGYETISVPFTRTEDGDLIAHCPANLKCVTYGLEISGKYEGNNWRWADCSIFRIVECNPASNVWGMESFAPETYYIYDGIIPSSDGESLVLDTHTHAWAEGTTLHLMSSEETEVTFDGNNIIINQHGRKMDEGCNSRPAWQHCCR